MSGITPTAECKEQYLKVKKGDASFGVFEIADPDVNCKYLHTQWKPDGRFGEFKSDEEGYPALIKYVTENLMEQAAYIVVSLCYQDGERDLNKLVMISWCPERKLKVKAKMLHGSTMNSCKQAFDGIQTKAVQCANIGDLEFANVYDQM